ncbi:MAG TPA: hypothetical protein VGB33_05565 [Acidimicrobiia bacterium]|jgi:Flp pilus assembly protein TadB
MITTVGLAVGFALGVDPRRLAILAGVAFLPYAVVGLIALVVWKSRAVEESRPALFCEGVASELRSGATLRDALTTSVTSVGARSHSLGLLSGSPMTEVAAIVASEFPNIGEELRLTIVNASRSGSDAAALFDEIGSLAIAQSEISREVRVATAPGKLTALVLVGAPMLFMASQLGSGDLGRLLASSEQRVVALIGLGVFALGFGISSLVLWRAGR